MNVFAWWNSGNAVLRYYRARELNDPTHPLYRIVARLAAQIEVVTNILLNRTPSLAKRSRVGVFKNG